MAKEIEPKLKFISDYLKIDEQKMFVIPEYQRGYSWTITQCDKLWQDVESYIDESNAKDPYFFGTIILDCSQDEEKNEMNLIDGQQRTTTFLLLLKALLVRLDETLKKVKINEDSRMLVAGLKSSRRTILEILYKADEEKQVMIADDWNVVKEGVLLLNKSINEVYKNELTTILYAQNFFDAEATVYKIPRKQKENKYTNFFRNFNFFYDRLGKLGESQLNVFAKTFLKKCQIIEIKSWQVEQAITMFNSLNSTGMPLSDADIISAQLYSHSGESKDEFNLMWEKINKIANELSTKKIVTIDGILQEFMYMNRAKNRDYIRNESVDVTTPGLRNFYLNIKPDLLKQPMVLCNTFKKIADIWDKAKDFPIVKILLKFNENAKLYLISYMMRFDLDDLVEEQINKIAETLIRLFAMLELVDSGYSSTNFKTFLFKENTKLIDASTSENDIVADFNTHISKNWNETETLSLIMDYGGNILVFLNDYLYAKSERKPFDFAENVNIEHIMPGSGRNIGTIRKDAKIDSEEEFKEYVNKLGNKILLEEDINKAIGNDWFRTKKTNSIKDKKGYKDSSFAIAKDLSQKFPKDTWTKVDIEVATEKAAKRIVKFIFNGK